MWIAPINFFIIFWRTLIFPLTNSLQEFGFIFFYNFIVLRQFKKRLSSCFISCKCFLGTVINNGLYFVENIVRYNEFFIQEIVAGWIMGISHILVGEAVNSY